MKTAKGVSRLTGVRVHTLHHYDAIGLLKPTLPPPGWCDWAGIFPHDLSIQPKSSPIPKWAAWQGY